MAIISSNNAHNHNLTFESIQHTIRHSVPGPAFFGTSIPKGIVNNISGVREVPRSLS
jgi:hypothetical protein